jgi:hypothetical protein
MERIESVRMAARAPSPVQIFTYKKKAGRAA